VRVLIIENQSPQVHLLRRGLHEEGFRVDVARTAEEGRHFAQSQDYSLLILSLTLPNTTGWMLLQTLRKLGSTRQILALVGTDESNDRVRSLNAGADDALQKPFSLMELVARCRALVRRAHAVVDPVLRIFDMEIDTNTRRVRRGGKTIDLTRREYALLQFLAFNRGKVVSRAMITEHLYDEATMSNVVDVFIRYLRAKIDRGFDLPLIQTRWGEGYVLRAADDHPAAGTPKKRARSQAG
jgi:DNA-binding response OmpR family regulator